ncbi:MAG: GntR family transcriptional regulator [Verrucomicrobiota bacterium JB024]|nr:GntR family transcriptional regulator [Verrucomicrobiota bacterium JB024]
MNIKQAKSGQVEVFETNAVRLYHQLQREILIGKLHPGERLVRKALCDRFKVSQSTVTEALWRLESDGLVESAPMYGTRVCEITMERTRNEHILREALECQVAREVTEVLRPDDEPVLLEMADEVDRAMQVGAKYSEAGMESHRSFHMKLAEITGLEILMKEMDQQWRRHLVLFNWISSKLLPVPQGWHRMLLLEIFSRDPDRAERAMRTHVRYGRSRYLEVVEEINSDHSRR